MVQLSGSSFAAPSQVTRTGTAAEVMPSEAAETSVVPVSRAKSRLSASKLATRSFELLQTRGTVTTWSRESRTVAVKDLCVPRSSSWGPESMVIELSFSSVTGAV